MKPRTVSPALMLILATLLWGVGFTWAKNAGNMANAAAGLADEAMFGPTLILATRFTLAAVLWMAIFPAARRGWSLGTLWRGGLLGLFLSVGVITQHIGLARASSATIAFLTSLTVVIVPVMIAVVLRRLPRPRVVVAVGMAVVGIWLLTGAKRDVPNIGELFGLACALFYSVELLLLNMLVPGDDPMRLTPLMFIIAAAASAATAAVSPGASSLHFSALMAWPLAIDLALMTVFSTFLAFGLMTAFQPKVDATRATLIYLLEPIFAAAYAWLAAGAGMGGAAIAGAVLILLANLAAEPSPDLSREE